MDHRLTGHVLPSWRGYMPRKRPARAVACILTPPQPGRRSLASQPPSGVLLKAQLLAHPAEVSGRTAKAAKADCQQRLARQGLSARRIRAH